MSAEANFRHAQALITEARDLIIDSLPPCFRPRVHAAFHGLIDALASLTAFLQDLPPENGENFHVR